MHRMVSGEIDHAKTIYLLSQTLLKIASTFGTFFYFQKAFHLVNRDLLQYKLKLIGINGPIYNVLSSLYAETFSCVCVNVIRTNRCLSSNSLRHWDNLSPTLFSLFINDSVSKISQLNVGIPIDHGKIGLLLTTLPFLVKMNLKCKDFRYSYRLVYAMEVECELWQIKYYAF